VAGQWFSPVSSTNKTDRHDITEILLKVALNTLNLKKTQACMLIKYDRQHLIVLINKGEHTNRIKQSQYIHIQIIIYTTFFLLFTVQYLYKNKFPKARLHAPYYKTKSAFDQCDPRN
jgi:hypothetical protein